MTHYDLAVIGAGSGNMILGRDFADSRVAICQDGEFGGTCLNVGCIPTKMFVHPADVCRSAADGPRLGARTSSAGADWEAIRERIFTRVDASAVEARQGRERQPNVDIHSGRARFTGHRTMVTGAGEEITADDVVIAAGSHVVIPDIPGLAQVDHHTSDTIMRLPDLPRRLAIIGGGYVAAEFAHVFTAYGTEVTQIHRGPRLLEHLDGDIAARFTEIAPTQWRLRLDAVVTRVERAGDAITLHLHDGDSIEVDTLLLATGRAPNTADLGLRSAGVATDTDGFVEVDGHLRTSAQGVWALGDVCTSQMLKHVANHHARVLRHNLRHPRDLVRADRPWVPHAVFTSPQIAAVGLTEEQAADRGLRFSSALRAYGDVAYGWAMADTRHFVKLIGDQDDGRLLGAHVIGPEASLLVQPLVQAMSNDQPVAGLARSQYWIHPALSEVVENALLDLETTMVGASS